MQALWVPLSLSRQVIETFAVDGDGDGLIDLFDNWNDIIMSVANYLKVNGWHNREDILAKASLVDSLKRRICI